ncbi:uncharacterized protein LY79DRAFT_572666 [Colletotrichum navitas]|uniref:Uncharacterized protein n=1 Tax=Colletotrichum navitas TaxID=681940 RepID=A0AAD8PKE2_9PEZI|nr:uncharacterized protein LY79DRAFT_572666 [Colletotrichum navitas]KAK1566124.1 hypothetical protein LY79DRAFT_572666 [Colletotrichum navitas]
MIYAQRTQGLEHQSATYHFAKPTQLRRNPLAYFKPLLVAQLQKFGAQGHLEETVDLLSVNFVMSMLFSDIRGFIKQHRGFPRFVLTVEDRNDKAASIYNGTQLPCKSLIGAVVESHDSDARLLSDAWKFWVGEWLISMLKDLDGSFNLFLNDRLVAVWAPNTDDKEILGFDLKDSNTLAIIASLRRGRLTVNGSEQLLNAVCCNMDTVDKSIRRTRSNQEEGRHIVLSTAMWVTHIEGWFTVHSS